MAARNIQTVMLGMLVEVQRGVQGLEPELVNKIVELRSVKDDAGAEAIWPWDPATVVNVYLGDGVPYYTVAFNKTGLLKEVPASMIRIPKEEGGRS